jgi:diguanylate cyclase (GGDEF)-like protein/PAS domain S-box-containing protein
LAGPNEMTFTMQESTPTGSSEERLRLLALDRYHILDTDPEPQFDDLAQVAATVCATPMAVVTLIDERRQWFKARVGMPVTETEREIAFCDYVVRERELLVVHDTHEDPRFSSNPLVTGEPRIRFYAGVPLITADGFALGSLAVLDRVPRTLSPDQEHTLRVLGREVMAQLELRMSLVRLESLLGERDRAQRGLRRSLSELEQQVAERTATLHRINETLKQEIEQKAREAAFSKAIMESLPGIFYVLDERGHPLRWNRNFERVSGHSEEQIAKARSCDFFATAAERALIASKLGEALRGAHVTIEAELLTRHGDRIPYYFTGARIELDGRACICGMGIDITERLRAENRLRLLERAMQASVNAIIITDLSGTIEYVNPSFERITGYPADEALGRNCRFLQGDDTAQAGVKLIREAVLKREECVALIRNYRKDGDLFWSDVRIAPVRGPDNEVTHFVGVVNDVTEIKHYERELERHVNVDPLTGLANRKVLLDRLHAAISAAHRFGGVVTVGFIDLDNFKFINDSLGHNVGDRLLQSVAERLVTCLRGEDTVARYGGDEFAFVLMGYQDEKNVEYLMNRILKTIDRPFSIEEHKFFVSCSIGLSFFPQDGADADTLLKNADAAMHLAKERGRNNYQFYTPAMNQRATQRLSMEGQLREALSNKEFSLHYQPKLDLRSGCVIGAEALLRWRPRGAKSGQAVSPSIFIPLAEETGLINAIGEWALHTACSHNKVLQDMGLPALRMAVNISARQFEPETIRILVSEALAASGLDAGFLELELTESMVMRRPEEAIRVLHGLKEMGLCLALDDFGTGYSNLSYLQRFPLDVLKIDRSLVRDIGADPNDAIIARAVIALGHNLGMTVVAEGVQTSEQLSFLAENGCDGIQGFLISKPLPFEEFVRFLKQERVELH